MNDNDLDDVQARLMAYVDGELDDAAAAETERWLAQSARLREDVAMYRETAMLLRAACGEGQYRNAPETTICKPAASASRSRGVRRVGMALAAGLALLLGGFGAGLRWTGGGGGDGLLDEVAEYNAVFSRETAHLVEVPATSGEEFSHWMSARLGRPVAAPDLRGAGLTYAGGRMLVIGGAPVADFLYTRAGGPPVALCIARARAGDASIAVSARDVLRLAHWSRNGLTYVVVGDLDPDAARRIAQMVDAQV